MWSQKTFAHQKGDFKVSEREKTAFCKQQAWY